MLGRLSQLPPREQLGLGLACAFALFFITDQVVVKKVTKTLGRMDVELEVAAKQVAHNQEVLQYKDSVEAEYEQVKNLIGVSGPEQEAAEAFSTLIDKMALDNGISLRSMQNLTPETTDFLVTYFVEISDFESETLSLINFLHRVQDAPGMLRLKRMSVASQNENSMVEGSLVISKVMTLAGEQE